MFTYKDKEISLNEQRICICRIKMKQQYTNKTFITNN